MHIIRSLALVAVLVFGAVGATLADEAAPDGVRPSDDPYAYAYGYSYGYYYGAPYAGPYASVGIYASPYYYPERPYYYRARRPGFWFGFGF
jgi:hypothetical protein